MKNRNELLNITSYIVGITLYFILFLIIYFSIYKMNTYYLFVAIPMLFLFVILSLSNLSKTIITLLLMTSRKNGNETTVYKLNNTIKIVNDITKNILIAIFITLLTSIMILDIVLCLYKDKIVLLSYSIVIWFLIYYFLFDFIKYKIQKDLNE